MYEERAVDVVIDNCPQDFSTRASQSVIFSKIVNNNVNVNGNTDKATKIRKSQGSNTVRSIPIKDYQASLAHNIGTLRRSVAPQSQFETLVSEPEKGIYVAVKKRVPVTSNLHHRAIPHATCTGMQIKACKNRKTLFCHFCNNLHYNPCNYTCANVDLNMMNKDAKDNQYLHKRANYQNSQNDSDIDEQHFHRNLQRKFSPNNNRAASRCTHDSSREIAGTITKNDKANVEKGIEIMRFGEGHVGQKISAYEQNARHSQRVSNSGYRSLHETKGHRTIGIPLVGMHNACGLPVVASWHNHEVLEPWRISRRVVGTVGPVYRNPRTITNIRRRTQPKRKAPQPDFTMLYSRDNDCNIKRSTVKSVAHLDAINRMSKRKHRRSSSSTMKVGSLTSRNSFKRTSRPRYRGIKTNSLVDTFGKKSFKGGNTKRTTLYAKDDGKDAVEVLKNLCLNPLARSNPEADMMW